MGRIEKTLASKAQEKRKVLALFLTAGFPERNSTVNLVLDLERGGADIVEIGMPFSDPLADGPIIQQSSQVALRNGTTLKTVLEDVTEIRKRSEIPIVLMGYVNPILRYGPDEFFAAAAMKGVDGVILPELPLEETGRFRHLFAQNGLSEILLVTPTTSPSRIEAIDDICNGFLYCVSRTGVTGAGVTHPAEEYIRRVKQHARKNPVLVGFGISTPADASALAKEADGVIIGSALIRQIGNGYTPGKLKDWLKEFRAQL